MAEQTDYAYELRALGENLVNAYTEAGRAVQESLAAMAASFSPPAVEDAQPGPDRFEHTDDYGDVVIIRRRPAVDEWQTVFAGESGVNLDQDAVNRLARYLDRHRTDLPKPVANPDPMDRRCGRNSDHTAHLYGRDDTELSCSGSREGAYGA